MLLCFQICEAFLVTSKNMHQRSQQTGRIVCFKQSLKSLTQQNTQSPNFMCLSNFRTYLLNLPHFCISSFNIFNNYIIFNIILLVQFMGHMCNAGSVFWVMALNSGLFFWFLTRLSKKSLKTRLFELFLELGHTNDDNLEVNMNTQFVGINDLVYPQQDSFSPVFRS